jgi:hypothetical protein
MLENSRQDKATTSDLFLIIGLVITTRALLGVSSLYAALK